MQRNKQVEAAARKMSAAWGRMANLIDIGAHPDLIAQAVKEYLTFCSDLGVLQAQTGR